eukprot:4770776-Amphidinium_carterae.1
MGGQSPRKTMSLLLASLRVSHSVEPGSSGSAPAYPLTKTSKIRIPTALPKSKPFCKSRHNPSKCMQLA